MFFLRSSYEETWIILTWITFFLREKLDIGDLWTFTDKVVKQWKKAENLLERLSR